MNHAPKVAVIVLNWNGKQDTLECLDSVFKIDYPNFEVVVVDNGSRDESVPAIRQAFPQAHLIETGRNLGYAGGNNVGIRHALARDAEFVFILNNDTVVDPKVLTHLAKAALDYPKAAVLGPVVYEMDRPNIIWTAGEFFSAEFTCSHHLQGKPKSAMERGDVYPADAIIGASFFVRSHVFSEIGLFDEHYFLVHEETDWCFRARARGHICLIVPKAEVWHKVASSFNGESSPLRAYFSTRNQLLFAEKNLPKKAWLKLVTRSLKRTLLKLNLPPTEHIPTYKRFYWAGREAIQSWRHPRQRAVRRGVMDYLLRRFSDCPPAIRKLNDAVAETATTRGNSEKAI